MKRKYPISNPRYQNGELEKPDRSRGNRYQRFKKTEELLKEAISLIEGGIILIDDGYDPNIYLSIPQSSFKPLREQWLPAYLKRQLNSEKITRTQYDTLLSQLASPDHEAWYLAFLMIKTIMKL